jgi:hypothetical protein
VIDLNDWHHAIHRVTGEHGLRFNRATAVDLQRWIRQPAYVVWDGGGDC